MADNERNLRLKATRANILKKIQNLKRIHGLDFSKHNDTRSCHVPCVVSRIWLNSSFHLFSKFSSQTERRVVYFNFILNEGSLQNIDGRDVFRSLGGFLLSMPSSRSRLFTLRCPALFDSGVDVRQLSPIRYAELNVYSTFILQLHSEQDVRITKYLILNSVTCLIIKCNCQIPNLLTLNEISIKNCCFWLNIYTLVHLELQLYTLC